MQLDIETFNKIEEVLENFALARLMEENGDEDVLELNEALAYYRVWRRPSEGEVSEEVFD